MQDFIHLIIFLSLLIFTPGPANLIAMTAGVSMGFAKSFLFILGILSGQVLVQILFAFGFGFFLDEQILAQTVLKFTGVGYMIWMVSRSWNHQTTLESKAHYSFVGGFWVHPFNPKGWVIVIIAWTDFNPSFDYILLKFTVLVASFFILQAFAHGLWCWMGSVTGRVFKHSLLFTRFLIVLTIATVLWAVLI